MIPTPETDPANSFTVTLTNDEALVLEDFLYILTASMIEGRPELSDPTSAELVLCKIAGALESSLVELFTSDYGMLLEEAGNRILRDRGYGEEGSPG